MTMRFAVNWTSLVIAAAALVTASGGVAQEVPRPGLRVSSGLEVSSNPFLIENGTGAVAAYIGVDPTIFVEEGRNTTVIDGSVRATQYLGDYGTDASGRLRLSTERALTERTTVGLSVAATSSRRNFIDGIADFQNTPAISDPSPLPDSVPVDPTLIGTLARSTTLSVNGSLSHRLSPVSSWMATGALSRSYFSNNAGFDVRSASGGGAYARRVGPRTTITFAGQLASFDFLGRSAGDALVYSLQARVKHQIGVRWNLELSGGADLVDRNLGMARRDTSSLFSGDVGLCNAGLRSRFCLTGRRAAQPTAVGGVATVLSVSASYKLELSKDDTLTFNSQFGRSGQSFDNGFPTAGTTVDVIGATANYRHALSARADFFVMASYSDVSDKLRDVPSNAFIRVGITFGLGRRG